MTTVPTAGIYVQYAGRISCKKHGCLVPHEDDGLIVFFGDERVETFYGHALEVLVRTVNFAPWIDLEDG